MAGQRDGAAPLTDVCEAEWRAMEARIDFAAETGGEEWVAATVGAARRRVTPLPVLEQSGIQQRGYNLS